MIRHSPHARAQELRRTLSQLIFAWGSVVSAAWYATLTLLGRPPLIDDHLTATALAMLASYLLARFGLNIWRQRALSSSPSRNESAAEDPDHNL